MGEADQHFELGAQPPDFAGRGGHGLDLRIFLGKSNEILGREVGRGHRLSQLMLLRLDRDDPVERNGLHAPSNASARGSSFDLMRRVTAPLAKPNTTISRAPFFTARSKRLRGLPVAMISTERPAARSRLAAARLAPSAASSSTTIAASIRSISGASISIASRSIPAAQPIAGVCGPPSDSINPS